MHRTGRKDPKGGSNAITEREKRGKIQSDLRGSNCASTNRLHITVGRREDPERFPPLGKAIFEPDAVGGRQKGGSQRFVQRKKSTTELGKELP